MIFFNRFCFNALFILVLSSMFLLSNSAIFNQEALRSLQQKGENTQFIIFGDSLSDSGNFPMPANVVDPDFYNFNLYIPNTNPVSSHLYGKDGTPDLNFLRASSPIDRGKINGTERRLYSINWPMYLFYNLGFKKLWTWMMLQNQTDTLDTGAVAVNYAWDSAVTGRRKDSVSLCFHDSGAPFPEKRCDAENIKAQRALYKTLTKQDPLYDKHDRYSYSIPLIPSLEKQVDFYQQDLRDNRLPDAQKKVFFIYIGANDIRYFLGNIENQVRMALSVMCPSCFFSEVDKSIENSRANIERSVDGIKNSIAFGKQYAIYLFTLPNFANFRSAYGHITLPLVGSIIRERLEEVIQRFNGMLQLIVEEERQQGVPIHLIPLGEKIDHLAASFRYRKSVEQGLTCIESSSTYLDPQREENGGCRMHGMENLFYFNWNRAHLISDIEKQMAAFLVEQLVISP